MNRLRRLRTEFAGALAQFWAARNAREQWMLMLAAACLFFVLLFVVAIDPALDGRRRLRLSVPVLRQQAAELRQLLAQAGPAAAAAARAPAAQVIVTPGMIETALARHALLGKRSTVGGDRVQLEFAGASFAGLIDFLQDIRKTGNLRVDSAKFSATPQPGMVDATIMLAQKKEE